MTLVDQEARDRITFSLDESLLIEAGAGTGKTTAVVQRVANLLATGTATVDDLAVVTFTKDAAAELVSRVREQLEAELGAAEDEQRRSRLEAALAGLYRARISTLHVFATTLLRERPVEARVDPGLRAIDGVERAQRMDAAYAAWLDAVLSRDDVDLRLALNRGFQLPQLRALCDLVDGQRAVLPLTPSAPADVDHAGFCAQLARVSSALAELAPQCHNADDLGIRLYPGLRDFAAAVAATQDDLALERVVLDRRPEIKPGSGAQGNWATKDACRDYKAAVGELRDIVDTFSATLRANALLALLPLAVGFVESFSEERRRDGVADFDDLLLWARELLRSDTSARGWLRRRYPHVIIDEFQDTDPLQAEIALLLTSADQAADWKSLTPAPGSLVVVGDPKQSIYRFRNADIATYDAVRTGPLAGLGASMTQNFRSVGGILDFSNHVFARVFADGKVGRQSPHVALEGSAVASVGERAAVVMAFDPEVGDDKLGAAELQRREADLLARTLRLAVAEESWPIRDGGGTRAARWSDIAILAPSVTGTLRTLGPALAACGIPFRATAGSGLFLQPEIAELASILHAVDDPTDEIHVVGALRSDAFGCSADDLVEYAALGARFDPRRVDPLGPKPVVDGLTALREWRSQRRGLSLPELVQRIVDGSGLVELALEQEGGAQAAGNVLRVVEEARTFAQAGGGLRAFTRWLTERRGADAESTEAVVADPSDPVVRIMTIHGAKGLEFSIVALAGFSSKGKGQAPATLSRDRTLELRIDKWFATPGYAELAEDEKELLQLERDRLLHVALTRARDHLIVPAVHARAHATGLLGRMTASLPEITSDTIGQDVDGVHVLDPALLPALDSSAPVADSGAATVELDAILAAEEAWVAQQAEIRTLAGRELVQTVASSVRPFDRIRPLAATATSTAELEATADIQSAPPLSVGSALHRVMDRIALDGSQGSGALVAAACLESGIPHAVPELTELVSACLSSPAVRRAAASGSARREIPFTITLPDGAGYAAGRADLVFRDGDELVLVDYKTDTLPDASSGTLADAVRAHSGQGAVYAAAIGQATGLRVREVVFVFPRVRAEQALEIDDQLLTGAADLMVSGSSSETPL